MNQTFSSAGEAVRYIESALWYRDVPGLDCIRELLRHLGDPQKKLKFIHIVGTNGKGSTASMLDAVLRKTGYKTGLFTSPYLHYFNERMRFDGEPIPDAELCDITGAVAEAAEKLDATPTVFELITAIAMEFFLRRGCDIVVLEAGVGGSLDSTNVIGAPEVAVFTNIGLDHMDRLGSTVAEIAATKAGVVKKGCHAVSYEQLPEAAKEIESACKRADAPLTVADFTQIKVLSDDLNGQVFDYGELKGLNIALLGEHQRKNAAVALETVKTLRDLGWKIGERAVREGLAAAKWPGRFELLRQDPVFIADGGHNPQCAKALRSALENYFPGRSFVFLLGVMADKNYRDELELLAPLAERFITVTPGSPRALPAKELAKQLRGFGKPAEDCQSIGEGVDRAIGLAGKGGMVCSFGSLYMTGAVRAHVLWGS